MPLRPVLFPAVKAVLDKIIVEWTAGNGASPDLIGVHGPSFSWSTSAALKAASAKGQPLIQPEIIGKPGLGNTANLVLDLTTGLGRFPKMPLGGLDSNNDKFLDPGGPEIMTIVDWIEGGCKG
jgi:hypothetical protein